MTSLLRLALAVWLVAANAGAQTSAAPPADPTPAPPAPAGTQAPAGSYALPRAPYGRYLIQASDTLSISYRYSPEYDFNGRVHPDGYISPPLLGEVRVAGLTI